VAPCAAVGQDRAAVGTEENFRREPNGLVLARLYPGASVRVLDTRDNWTQVEVGGWVWMPSLQVSNDPDMTLVVAASGGENLRVEPSGAIVGRLVDGALLAEVERIPSWARVTRVGWIWSPSLEEDPVPPSPQSERAGEEARAAPAAIQPARRPGGFVGSRGGPILAAPDGDTLAVARPASDVEVVRREGNWARVRLEGWMWMPAVPEPSADPGADEGVSPLEPADMSENPEAVAGRVVAWSLQFISLERAEAVRTDFFEGEPFLLTRFGGSDGPFVYVAVSPDRLEEVQGLVPLERIEVTGRVRTPASSLTGVPIIDLVSIDRRRGDP